MMRPLLLLALVSMSGCSNRNIYDAVQTNRQLDCQRYPDTRYEECTERSATSYDQYAEDLRALDEETSEQR